MNKYYKGMIKAVKNGDKSAEEELLTTLNYIEELQSQLEQKEKQLNDIKEYIKKHSKDSELTIYGLPDCKVFMGSLEDLLSIIERDNCESKK